MTRTRTRWAVILATAAAVGGLLLFLLWPRPVAVDAAGVRQGPIADVVSDQGTARVRQAYVVSAPIAGRLERVPLEVGDWIDAGKTVVACIRPTPAAFLDPRARAQAQSTVAAARAALDAAAAHRDRLQAEAVRARKELQRIGALEKAGAVAKQDIDNAQASADAAVNAVAAADADIRTRRADLASAESALTGPDVVSAQSIDVTSPASGVVTRLLQQSERTVTAGTQLVEVADTMGLEAAVEFLSQDAVKIRPGAKAEIYDWGGPPIPAEVRRVEPQGFTKVSALGIEEQRTLVILQLSAAPSAWDGLAPGYRVWGRVYLRELPAATLAPLGALIRDNGGWAVYRIEDGHAHLRSVDVGVMTDRDAEIKSGLSPGDHVVIYPSDLVHDGVSVAPRARAAG